MIWLQNWWVGFEQQSLTHILYGVFLISMTNYFQVCEVSTSCLTKHTFPIFHELSVCTNQNYFKFGIELYFCCILYKWVSGLLRLYVSRSILLLILQHNRPTFVIVLKFRLGEACSHIGALLFLIAEQVASGKNLPDDLSATDQLCAWKDPKSKCNLAFFTFLEF